MVAQLCEYSKSHWIVHFKQMNRMVHEYLNTTKKSQREKKPWIKNSVQSQQFKPEIPCLGPVPLLPHPTELLNQGLPPRAVHCHPGASTPDQLYEKLRSRTWASGDFWAPSWFPVCSHVLDGWTFLKLCFVDSGTLCLCPEAVIYMQIRRFGMKFWSKQLPICFFSGGCLKHSSQRNWTVRN